MTSFLVGSSMDGSMAWKLCKVMTQTMAFLVSAATSAESILVHIHPPNCRCPSEVALCLSSACTSGQNPRLPGDEAFQTTACGNEVPE